MSGDGKIYDFIIFGATGFTGQFVVDEVAKVAEEEGILSWAVAGRSVQKLQNVLQESSKRTGKNVEELPVVIADTANPQSLVEMAKQCRVVLNCVGPYRFYGEPVVRACIEGQASHVDISGEPVYLEKMQMMYGAKAKEADVFIIGACGFDSIPADLGIFFTQNGFIGDLNVVEGFLEITSPEGFIGNTGTLESAVYGFAFADELKPIRQVLFPNPLPRSAHRPPKRSVISYNDQLKKWCLPFPGSDRSVVQRTQRYNLDVKKQRPVQFVPYFCRPSRLAAFAMALFAVIFAFMAKFSLTRKLLLAFPSFFTAGTFKTGGPSLSQIKSTSFSWTFYGSGYSQKLEDPDTQHEEDPDSTIVTQVSGPEPGYVATPICMVQAALVLIKEKNKLPKEGGVYTPAAAFADTTMIERLNKRGVVFQKLEQ